MPRKADSCRQNKSHGAVIRCLKRLLCLALHVPPGQCHRVPTPAEVWGFVGTPHIVVTLLAAATEGGLPRQNASLCRCSGRCGEIRCDCGHFVACMAPRRRPIAAHMNGDAVCPPREISLADTCRIYRIGKAERGGSTPSVTNFTELSREIGGAGNAAYMTHETVARRRLLLHAPCNPAESVGEAHLSIMSSLREKKACIPDLKCARRGRRDYGSASHNQPCLLRSEN